MTDIELELPAVAPRDTWRKARIELFLGTYNYLDLTPLGRQEDWEEPAGRNDDPPMSWLNRHDEYDDADRGDERR